MIFGRAANLDWANEMVNIYLDGTFSITPPPFNQVYAILAEKEAVNGAEDMFSRFCMPRSRTRTGLPMTSFFWMVRSLMPHLNPESINVDFEQVALNSLRFAFPDADLNGCFFHLMKNFKKHLGEAGLMAQYRDPTSDFALTSRMILSLAFVPPLDVYECFHELQVYLINRQPCLEPVLKWFSSNYVGTVMRPPPFPVSLWSCYERTLRGENRTNNFAEAAHRRLQRILDIHHPTMGLFVGEMKKAQKLSDHTYEQCLRGQPAPKKEGYTKKQTRGSSPWWSFMEQKV